LSNDYFFPSLGFGGLSISPQIGRNEVGEKPGAKIAGSEETIKEVSVRERRCVGLGDEYCEFLIKF